MANIKAASSLRSSAPAGKQSLLPPRCPFPVGPSSSGDTASKGILDSGYGQSNHRRTSSECFFIEEQPAWLDDLLNEPETPVKRGSHRRSSSDSFAFLNTANLSSSIITNLHLEEGNQRSVTALSPWGFNEHGNLRDINHGPYYVDNNSHMRSQHTNWEAMKSVSSIPIGKDKTVHKRSFAPREHTAVSSDTAEKTEQQELAQEPKGSLEKNEDSLSKQSEVDPRAKQQFARRSRVRKLQYIAELERNIQGLQAEGMEMSAELEFLDRQNLVLNLENRSLKQRLDNLSQEHVIKRLQQEMLERELSRLRMLYQQQQQQSIQQPAPKHTHSRSIDFDSQFANLSLKPKDMDNAHDPATGPLHI